MKSLGKLLQLFGLIILPLSMVMEMSGELSRDSGVSDMVLMMVTGAAAFAIGRIVEGYASR